MFSVTVSCLIDVLPEDCMETDCKALAMFFVTESYFPATDDDDDDNDDNDEDDDEVDDAVC